MKQLERFLEWGGAKKDIAFLVISGAALITQLSKRILRAASL